MEGEPRPSKTKKPKRRLLKTPKAKGSPASAPKTKKMSSKYQKDPAGKRRNLNKGTKLHNSSNDFFVSYFEQRAGRPKKKNAIEYFFETKDVDQDKRNKVDFPKSNLKPSFDKLPEVKAILQRPGILDFKAGTETAAKQSVISIKGSLISRLFYDTNSGTRLGGKMLQDRKADQRIYKVGLSIPPFSRSNIHKYLDYMTMDGNQKKLLNFYYSSWFRQKSWDMKKAQHATFDYDIKALLGLAKGTKGDKKKNEVSTVFAIGLGQFNTKIGMSSKHSQLVKRFVARVK
ncbi:hypothetical protein BG011_009788 [Mortierella polycephala]|uniref:Uncharacterized protein n=1 Tax=Mortierella polycephala TaxID=41804 RepID=A0A9P6Q8E5_9FUNG|nr:hypothetical protein BG011_009788 [Mortierella polycephala]